MWVLIGKIALAVWLTFTPEEQVKVVQIVAQSYCEQMQCHKPEIVIFANEEMVFIVATCKEKET